MKPLQKDTLVGLTNLNRVEAIEGLQRGLSDVKAGRTKPAREGFNQTVNDRTGLSRSTIWRLERAGALPKHNRISASAVAWVQHDVVDWIRAKAGAR